MRLILLIACSIVFSFAHAQIVDSKNGKTLAKDELKSGAKVTVTGLADNSRSGAIIVVKDVGLIYIDGLPKWDKEYFYKQLEVSGTLKVKTTNNQGLTSTHISIKDASWKKVE